MKLSYVHPRKTKKISSNGIGTPKAHRRIHPTFPACISFDCFNIFILVLHSSLLSNAQGRPILFLSVKRVLSFGLTVSSPDYLPVGQPLY